MDKDKYKTINVFNNNSSLTIYKISTHFYDQFKQVNLKVITNYITFMEKTFKQINKNMEKIDLKTFQEINRRQLLLFFNSLDINDFFNITFNVDYIGRIFSLLIESYETFFGIKYYDFSNIEQDEDFFEFQKQLTFVMKNYQNMISIQLKNEKFKIEEMVENLLLDDSEDGFNENDLYFEPIPTQQKFVTGMEQYENLFLLIDNLIYDIFSNFNTFIEIKRDIQYDYKKISDIMDYQITNSGFIIEIQENTQKNIRLNKSLLKNKKTGDVKNVFHS